MNKREDLIRRIKDCLAIYAVRVDMDKGEASRAAETFYCGLLNSLMGYDLQNMNLARPNYPAIDLGDDAEGLGVQVTSTATRGKVQDTLDAMFRNDVQKEYPHLVMLITKEWRESRKAFRMDGVCRFDPEKDIWDTKWLLAKIEGIMELEKLEEIQKHLKRHLYLVREPVPTLNLPLQSALAEGAFVGREEELAQICERFKTEKVVVLFGLGGMGKTELAVKFGREYEKNGGGWVYFVPFRKDFYHTVVDKLALGIPGLKERGLDEKAVYQAAMEVLRGCGEGDLLIVDNADEGSITNLRRELSKLPMRTLMTSRKAVAGAVKVEPLPNGALYTVFEQNGVSISRAEMDELIDAVNAHTLTVDVMARTMGRGRRTATAAKLLAALKERDLSKGFTKVEIAYAGSPEQARINEHLKAVFRVAELEKEAQRLLRCATLLPEGGMDDGLFLSPFDEEAGDRLDDLIEGGWLYMKDELLRIHPVIRIVCIEVLEPTEEKCERFLVGIHRQYDRKQYNAAKFRQMAELFETAANTLEDKHGFWAGDAGYFWKRVGELGRTLELEKRAVEHRELHQPDSEALAKAYDYLGMTYGDLGDHKQALEYQMKALSIFERVLGADHPDIATAYNNMGMTYDNLGDHKRAREYLLKALSIFERVLGVDHPDLATSYNNVGITYDALGDHKQALEYKLKALAICERVLEADHPDLAAVYASLGYTYGKLGDHEEELEYGLKALAIFERVLPGNHPNLALSCNNIAWGYYALGRIGEATSHMCRAAEIINRSSLPENHTSRVNYNKWAERLEREARRVQEKTV